MGDGEARSRYGFRSARVVMHPTSPVVTSISTDAAEPCDSNRTLPIPESVPWLGGNPVRRAGSQETSSLPTQFVFSDRGAVESAELSSPEVPDGHSSRRGRQRQVGRGGGPQAERGGQLLLLPVAAVHPPQGGA